MSFRVAAFLGLCILVGAQAQAGNLVDGSCVADGQYDGSVDYFPDKILVDFATHFEVTYNNSYKVCATSAFAEALRLACAGPRPRGRRGECSGAQDPEARDHVVEVTAPGNEQKFVLYQCGTPVPNVPDADKYFSVPITKSVVAVTTLLPWIEQLGERATIAGWGTVAPYSPCTASLLRSGEIVDAANGFNTNYTTAEAIGAEIVFESFTPEVGAFARSWKRTGRASSGSCGTIPKGGLHPLAVAVTEYLENSVLTTGEWIEFMSLFYNKEAEVGWRARSKEKQQKLLRKQQKLLRKKHTCNGPCPHGFRSQANAIFTTMKETYECHERRADFFQGNNYSVAWVEWSTFDNAWDIGACPNYFCETTEDAGGRIVTAETAGVVGSVTGFFGPRYTDAEFLQVVRDVDVLIIKSGSWDDLYGPGAAVNKTDVLNQLVAVEAQRVYDVTRLGLDAWFEERSSEPDVLLEDVMSVLNNDLLALEHTRVWLRDVFAEEASPETTCEDPTAPRVVRGDGCEEPSDGNVVDGLCIQEDQYDPEVDYFPVKMTVDYALSIEVEYFNSYKIVRNTAVDETVVLYQCGTPRPTVAGVEKYISVPVRATVVAVTTIIPWIEQLGERGSIAALGTSLDFVYSPCVRALVDSGDIEVAVAGFSPDYTYIETELDVDVIFTSFPTDASDIAVAVTEYNENTVLNQGEWVEFLALFYNKEALGTELVTQLVETYECNLERADALGLQPKPTVSWIEWKGSPGGWEIGPCPNYFCEVSEGAGGEYIEEGAVEGSISRVDFLGNPLPSLYTDEELLAVLGDVDYLVVKSVSTDFTLGWHDIYGETADPSNNKTLALNQFKAVQMGNTYDVARLGGDAWFEERVSEPDVLLEDMIAILNPDVPTTVHTRVWLRNVFTEEEMPETSCPDPEAPRLQRGDACTRPATTGTDSDDDDSTTLIAVAVIVPLVVVGLIVAAVLITKPWNASTKGKPDHALISQTTTLEEAQLDSRESDIQ
eukprot:scaffold1954_cov268-Pinguiococcus_pyrenoidosus.AAC.175